MIEMLPIIKDIVVAAAAIITALSAVWGVFRWQSEMRGRASFEVARGLIKAAIKLREEIFMFRSPFVRAGEFPVNEEKQRLETKSAEAWAYVLNNRWRPVIESFKEFQVQVIEAEALWGTEIRNRAEVMEKITATLYAAVESFITDKQNGGQDFQNDRAFGARITAILNRVSTDDDFSAEVSAAVNNIESHAARYLSRKV